MKQNKYFIILFLITIFFTSCNDVTLNITNNISKGDTFKYNMEYESNADLFVIDDKITTKQNLSINYLLKVEEVNDEEIKINFNFNKIKYSSSSPGSNINYDSSKKEDNSFLLFNSLINNSFSVLFLKNGEIKKINGVKEIVEKATSKLENAEESLVFKNQLSELLGEDAINNYLSQSLHIFPSSKIKTGTNWSMLYNYNIGIPLSISVNYSANQITNDYVNILSKADIKTNNSKSVYKGIEIATNLNGKISGNQKINKKTPLILQNNNIINVEGTVNLDNQKAPFKAAASIKYSITK